MEQSEGMTQLSSFLAECDVRIEASPETVFRFFVDADKMRMSHSEGWTHFLAPSDAYARQRDQRVELIRQQERVGESNSRHEGVELAG